MDDKYAGPDAWPLFFFHGAPDSRLARHPDNELDGAAGARLITADRSGYGSTRRPGRRLLDWAPEVAALADPLGVERFSVMGWSAGGPSALPSRILARTGWRRSRLPRHPAFR